MANEMQPRNIFEVINQNIVDMSADMVELFDMVKAIYRALYPETTEPNVSGTGEQTK